MPPMPTKVSRGFSVEDDKGVLLKNAPAETAIRVHHNNPGSRLYTHLHNGVRVQIIDNGVRIMGVME